MKTATATLNDDKTGMAEISAVIKAALKELSEIRKANRATDAEIRHLRTATRQ